MSEIGRGLTPAGSIRADWNAPRICIWPRDDIPVFLRSFLNCYAVDILPNDGYIFNEHAVHGPPDKIFEEAAFLERFRNLLVMEEGDSLWLARATPRAWLEQGKKITREERPDPFRHGGLRDRLRRGSRQDHRDGRDAVPQSAQDRFCCGSVIPKIHH